MLPKKIQNINQLKKIVSRLKARGKTVAFTNGCFDLLHYGHIKYLRACKKAADILIVGVNSDKSVKRIKGKKRPVTRLKERIEILSCLEPIDYLISFDDQTPYKLIKKLMPDLLIKGADWKINDIVGKRIVESYGGRVSRVPYDKSVSTSKILEKIAERFKKK